MKYLCFKGEKEIISLYKHVLYINIHDLKEM